MSAVELYRPNRWWPGVEPVRTAEVGAYVVRRHPALVPNPANPVHAYYPHVAATLGVRVVVAASWTVEVPVEPVEGAA